MNADQISKQSHPFWKNPLSIFILFGLLGFIALVLFLASQLTFRFDGASMQPSLDVGEYVWVNRFAYLSSSPQRGDIIVLNFPNDRDRQFGKRIIGLPNDTISMMGGDVTINGVLIDEPYIKDRTPNNQT